MIYGVEARGFFRPSLPSRVAFMGCSSLPDLLGAPDFIEIDDSVQEAAEGNLTTMSFPAPGLNYDPGNSSL